MKKNFIIKGVLFLVFMSFVIWKFNKTSKEAEDIMKKTNKDYPLLRLKDSVDGIIINIYKPPLLKIAASTMYVVLSNGTKYYVSVEDQQIVNNSNFLNIGDSLIKRSGSDTLIINGKVSLILRIFKK